MIDGMEDTLIDDKVLGVRMLNQMVSLFYGKWIGREMEAVDIENKTHEDPCPECGQRTVADCGT